MGATERYTRKRLDSNEIGVQHHWARDQLLRACNHNGLLADNGEGRCNKTIDQGFDKVGGNGSYIPNRNGARMSQKLRRSAGQNTKVETNGATVEFDPARTALSGDVFIFDDPKDVPALSGNGSQVLWAEGEALMVASLPGLGKTTLAGLLVRAQLGLGEGRALSLPVREISGTILYLAMDRPTQIG